MEESLRLICRNRRAFQGKNLYTKGACYAGLLLQHPKEAKTVYFCDYKVKDNIMLKTAKGDAEFFCPLVEAGSNRHQLKKDLRILLEGKPVLELWVQEPGSREAKIESLELSGLAAVENERIRLSLHVSCAGGGRILLKVCDLGWGQMRPARGLEWEFEI